MMSAIAALWNDPQRCREAGRANQRLAEAFTWENHTRQLLGIYQGVMKAGGRR